jgi:predicted enzyme related to lactoylglutathione lyase
VPTQTSLVTGVDFVTVPTEDYEAAAEFYEKVLGLPFGKRWGKMPAGEFETGDLTIAVMQSDAFGIDFSPHKHPIALRVEDLEAARKELESRGVSFKGETIDSGVCYQAFFEDPDGNVLGLHQRYAPRD